MNYSIIVPTLNEVDNIDSLITRLLALPGFAEMGELIFVDDGSTDSTIEKLQRWCDQAPVRLVQRSGTPDLTRAVCDGVAVARHDAIVVMDADLSHPPERVADLLAPLAAGTHDIVVGSRYVAGGAVIDWPLHRRLLSRLAGLLAWPICDLSDPTSGFFAARRTFFERLSPQAAGYKVALELVVAADGTARIAEIPITFRDRVAGRSKLSIRADLLYLTRLVALAGSRLSAGDVGRCATVGLVGAALDGTVFWLLWHSGAEVAVAQIAGFVAAIAATILLHTGQFVAKSSPASGASIGRSLRFLLVALLGLALRCCVLAWAAPDFGLPIGFAIAGAILATGVVICLGSIFYVFTNPTAADGGETRWRVMSIGLIAYVFVLRLAYFGLPQLSGNEAYYWAYAQHPSLSYLDHPPMVAWLIWLGTHLVDHSELGVRLGAPVCWLIAVIFTFHLTRDLFGKSAAIRAALLMAVMPYFYRIGVSMTPDTPLVACWAAALFFLSRLLIFGDRRAWLGLALAFGLGLLSKYSIPLLALAAFVFLMVDANARRWLRRPEPYWAIVLAAVLFTPVLVWNAENGWASFLFQSIRRLEGEKASSGSVGAWGLLVVLAAPTVIAAIALSFFRPDIGAVSRGADGVARPGRRFLRIALLIPLGAFLALSFYSPVKPHWMGPPLLAGLPLAAEIMRIPALRTWRAARVLDWAWAPTIVILALVFGFGFPYWAIGLPLVPGPPGATKWREIASAVDGIEHQVEQQTGIIPWTVAMDSHALASELSFYDPDGEISDITTQHIFGRKGLMYAYWLPASEAVGRPLILVGEDPTLMSGAGIDEFLDTPQSIQEIATGQTKSRRRFYYRVARGLVISEVTTDSSKE